MIHTQDLPLSLGAHSRHSSLAAETGSPLEGREEAYYVRMYVLLACTHTTTQV